MTLVYLNVMIPRASWVILARSCTPSSLMCCFSFIQLLRNATCNANDEFGQGPFESLVCLDD